VATLRKGGNHKLVKRHGGRPQTQSTSVKKRKKAGERKSSSENGDEETHSQPGKGVWSKGYERQGEAIRGRGTKPSDRMRKAGMPKKRIPKRQGTLK